MTIIARVLRPLALLLGGVGLGIALATSPGVSAQKTSENELPLAELRAFSEVFEKIKTDYVESIDDTKLLRNAIRGMLSGLDPHSSYLVPEDYRDLRAGTTGEFGGLGIEVGMENGFIRVIAPIDDTPAHRAGVQAGDLIVRIDDTPVKGLTLNEAVKRMRGKPGSKIRLTILRHGGEKPFKLTITRAVIKVTSIRARILSPGYGYLRISQFQSRTSENMVERLNELEYVRGEIWANIWYETKVARIDPSSGAVIDWIALAPLRAKAGVTATEAVANGIAYDAAGDRAARLTRPPRIANGDPPQHAGERQCFLHWPAFLRLGE